MAYTSPAPSGGVRFSSISDAAELLKQQPAPYIIVTAAYLAVAIVLGLMAGMGALLTSFGHGGFNPGMMMSPMGMGVRFIIGLLGSVFMVCIVNLAIQQVQGQALTLAGAVPTGDRLLFGVLYAIIVGFLSGLASIACFIPTFFVQALLLPGLVLVLMGSDIGAALQSSANAIKPYLLSAAVLFFVFFVMNFVGAMLCGVGLLVTVPVVAIAIVLVARDVFGMAVGGAEPFIPSAAPAGSWPSPPAPGPSPFDSPAPAAAPFVPPASVAPPTITPIPAPPPIVEEPSEPEDEKEEDE